MIIFQGKEGRLKNFILTFNCSPATGVRTFPSGLGALGSGTGAKNRNKKDVMTKNTNTCMGYLFKR